MKILLTGGSGLLGTEIQKHLSVDAPSHKIMDVSSPITLSEKYDLVVHAAAYTDVVKAEKEKDECYKINVLGTVNMLNAFKDTPFVYVSSEYAKNPVNYYAETKRLAEIEVKKRKNPYLIIRTLFKPNPFPHRKAFFDQYTKGDYVDVITPLLIEAIKSWDRASKKLIYIGTGRKTIFELAKRTRSEVKPMSIKEITSVNIPTDYR